MKLPLHTYSQTSCMSIKNCCRISKQLNPVQFGLLEVSYTVYSVDNAFVQNKTSKNLMVWFLGVIFPRRNFSLTNFSNTDEINFCILGAIVSFLLRQYFLLVSVSLLKTAPKFMSFRGLIMLWIFMAAMVLP